MVVGGHYDHVGTSCERGTDPTDTICNGATDNAAGAAAVLQVGRSVVRHGPPRRSVVLALWDREEDGLLGSAYYVDHPLVPLEQTVGYVNFDIAGANLLPSLRDVSFAVATETGGGRLSRLVARAADTTTLDTRGLSAIFGQGRSDYVNFIAHEVPTVFFTDATGPCYHTVDDEYAVVDFAKLRAQAAIAGDVTRRLANGRASAFVAYAPPASYRDAQTMLEVVKRAEPDIDRFAADDQVAMRAYRDALAAIVADGADAFGDDDVATVLSGAANAVRILTTGACDGFLEPVTP